MQKLLEPMNKSDRVKAIQVTCKDFSDLEKVFTHNYGSMKLDSIPDYHLFTYEFKSAATITYQTIHLTQALIK